MEISDAGPDHENVVETAARNRIARNGEIQRVIRTLAADRNLDHRALGPLEHFSHAVGSQPLGRLGIDFQDDVPRTEPGVKGGRAGYRQQEDGFELARFAGPVLYRHADAEVLAIMVMEEGGM